MTLESLDKVPDVEIDPSGVFKYILIRVYAKQTADGNEPSKMIVRGNARGPYHGEKNIIICSRILLNSWDSTYYTLFVTQN